MDTKLDDVVGSLIADVQARLNTQIERTIIEHVRKTLDTFDFEGKINLLTSLKIDNKIGDFELRPELVEAKLQAAADIMIEQLNRHAKSQITSDIAGKINSIDFDQSMVNAIAQQVEARLGTMTFPDNSVPFAAINNEQIYISGDQIQGGIIEHFGSTGIDDRSTAVALTILDEHTIVENNLIAASADIKGSLKVEGDLVLRGSLPADSQAFRDIVENATNSVLGSMDLNLFGNYKDLIFAEILEKGIDLPKITVGGAEVIVDNRIGNRITESNLQKLGQVKDLQTRGETFLSDSLYISAKRVGVNTIEPGYALTVWDQEVEIAVSKQSQNTGMIGTPRNQELILSSNNKHNLVCRPDGSVQIDQLTVGEVRMISSPGVPKNDLPRGTIVWNSTIALNEPVGWVSLGGAKYAQFGIITG
jgi:hypothetical protein